MRYSEYDLPRGTAYIRGAIAKAVAGGDALRYAADRWGVESGAYLLTKADVGASAQSDELLRAGEMRVEFLDAVRQATALDRLALRRVPRNVPGVTVTGRARAYWRGQGKAAKVSAQTFDRSTLSALSIGALTVFANELLDDSSPEAEALILRDLVQALATGSDASFFDPDNGGTDDVEPAAVTFTDSSTVNPPTILATTGNLVLDVQYMLSNFAGQLSTSAFVCHPKLAAVIGLTYRGAGLAVDVGANGGTLAGLPVYVTEGLSADSSGAGPLILVDGAGIVAVDEGASVDRSDVALIEMADDAAQDSLAPTAPTGKVISLFQTENTAMLASRRINWRVARAGSVVVVADADYSAGS